MKTVVKNKKAGKNIIECMSSGISVIIPAYKEGGNLKELVTRLYQAFEDSKGPIRRDQVEVIVVDDNSQVHVASKKVYVELTMRIDDM